MADSSESSRREFLKGEAGVRALQGAVNRALGSTCENGREEDAKRHHGFDVPSATDLILTVRRRAMACNFEVHLPVETRGAGTEAGMRALDLVDELESQLTVYRPTSDVIRINSLAAIQPVKVEDRLFELLALCVTLSKQTGGAFDITSSPLSEIWGFSRRQGRLPSGSELDAALQRVGYESIVLDYQQQTVSFAKPGVAINLNSIGKGYALDRVAILLHELGMERYLLHGGNSSVLGLVTDDDCPAWQIGLRNPVFPTERLGHILVRNSAVGTSGSGTQYFHHAGRRYGHILDPRTGQPAEGVLSATVLAPSGAEADALATAFYVMGPQEVAEYCQTHRHIRAILVCSAKRGRDVEVLCYGTADECWQPS